MRTLARSYSYSGALVLALVIFSAGFSAAEDPPRLVDMRGKFQVEKSKRLESLLLSYGQALQREMTELTQAGKLDEAIAFKKEMEGVQQLLVANAGPPAGSAVESKPPSGLGIRRGAVDFLKLADAKRGGGESKWIQVEGALISPGTSDAYLNLPYQPPEEYDFTITFIQPRYGRGVTLVMPKKTGDLFDLSLSNHEVGLEADFSHREDSTARGSDFIKPDEECTLSVEVRRGHITAVLNGVKMFRYGAVRDHLELSSRGTYIPKQLAIKVEGQTVITKLEVAEVTGRGTVLEEK